MADNHTIMLSVIYGMITFFVTLIILFPVYFIFGLFTGVYGICAFAPEWWAIIYWKLYILIPIVAVIAGITVGRGVDRNSQEQLSKIDFCE